MPGEFGGGSIEIKTKTIPDKKYVKVSLSQSLTPFEGAQTYEGESSDWSGFHGARREMPALLKNYVAQGKNISTVSPEERRALAQSINKSYKTSEVSSQDLSQIPNMSLSMGNKYRHRKWMWGYNFSSLYSNKWSLDTAENWSYDQTGTDLTLSTYNEKEKSKNTVKMGAMLGVGVEYKKQKFSYNGMLLRNTLNYVYEPEGFGNDNKQYGYKEFELGWSERFVESHQISGEHIVNDLYDSRFIWNATLSKAVLDEPDNKFYTYIKENDVYKVETENGSASNWVSWNHMPDSMKNFGLNYSQSFDLFRIKEAKFKFGVNHMDRVRVYSSHTFYYRVDNASLSSQGSDVDDIFSDPDAQLYQQANATNSYSANHSIDAYYTNFIFPLSNLTLTSGFRFERSFQQVESFRLFGAGKTISTLETQDYLPVVSATYKLTQKSQIRFNFSETVSRPDLREISKTTWVDSEEGAKYTGNPSLLAAEIQNIGMRWEWFPQTGEVLSLGYFQKNFVRPIEEIFGSLSEDGRVVGTTETRYTFLNIDEAINRGIEFEFRKKLPKNFYFGGNYSWIDSQASISKEHSGQLTSLERTLQGQSPYLMNLQFDYEPPKWKASFSLLYNAMGRRITGVGANGRPDEYQEEVSSLDFTASKEVYKNWKFEFKAKNILDPEVRRTQGDKITYFAKKGQEYSVGLSGRF
jgi:outer membrane receptor protein involved in Fe transport